MLVKSLIAIGLIVVSCWVTGGLEWANDLVHGNTTPEQAPSYINNEFVDIGVAVPVDGGSGGGGADGGAARDMRDSNMSRVEAGR